MKSNSICLDFKSIFSPYLLATALAAKSQGQIAKIYAPKTAQHFEVWSKVLPRPVTFYLEEKTEYEALLGFSNFFGFSRENVEANDVFAALYIFNRALSDGLIEFIDTSTLHVQMVQDHANGNSYPDFYKLKSPSESINICPDMAGATLEGMVGMSIERIFRPVFGDHQFLNYFARTAQDLKLGLLVTESPKSKSFSEIIDLGIPLSAQELYKYSSDRKFFSIVRKVSEAGLARADNDREAMDVIIDGASMTVEAIVGAPVVSVPKLVYDAVSVAMRRRNI